MHKPYAESRDQNREPILAVLREVFADRREVLEIGTGCAASSPPDAGRQPHPGLAQGVLSPWWHQS